MSQTKIKIITTGGTLDKIYFDKKSEYQVGEPQVAEILRRGNVTFDFEIESIIRKDSLDLTAEDIENIRSAVENSPTARVLLTHGTDRMIETALALQKIAGKVIVLTGSMEPARFRGTDADFNIGFAICAVQCLPPGVYLAMNGVVWQPDAVRKNIDANRFEDV